jgi:predicted amidohydrolase
MRIAILQFAPRLAEPEWNVSRADALLAEAGFDVGGHNIEDNITKKLPLRKVDLLVLPEMAFSGEHSSFIYVSMPRREL